MTKLATTKGPRGITKFKPEESKDRQAKADAVIQYATEVKNWPLLEDAIDQKLDEQEEFVRWWRETPGQGHGGDRKSSARIGALDPAHKKRG